MVRQLWRITCAAPASDASFCPDGVYCPAETPAVVPPLAFNRVNGRVHFAVVAAGSRAERTFDQIFPGPQE